MITFLLVIFAGNILPDGRREWLLQLDAPLSDFFDSDVSDVSDEEPEDPASSRMIIYGPYLPESNQ